MPRKPVAVVVAMRPEVAPLVGDRRQTTVDGVKVFEWEATVIAVGGIGRAAARRAADVLIAHYAPSVLISAGIAGALTDALKVGDVVQAREVVDADSGERFAADGDAGTIVTVSSVSGAAEKRILAKKWQANVVDMEASGVAQVAKENGIAFAAVKAISDDLDFAMPPVGRFVDAAGKFHILRFVTYLAVHPQWWSAVRQLNSNSGVAAAKLSEALRHLIGQWSHIDSNRSKVEAR